MKYEGLLRALVFCYVWFQYSLSTKQEKLSHRAGTESNWASD